MITKQYVDYIIIYQVNIDLIFYFNLCFRCIHLPIYLNLNLALRSRCG